MHLSEYQKFRAENIQKLQLNHEDSYEGNELEHYQPIITPPQNSIYTPFASVARILNVQTATQTYNKQFQTQRGSEPTCKCQKLLVQNQKLKKQLIDANEEIMRLRQKLEQKEIKDREVRSGLKNWLRKAKGNINDQ